MHTALHILNIYLLQVLIYNDTIFEILYKITNFIKQFYIYSLNDWFIWCIQLQL